MRIDVMERGRPAPTALRNYVGLRLMTTLDQLVSELERVEVGLVDAPAPAGGIWTRCRIQALMSGGGDLTVDREAHGTYAAIDHAATALVSEWDRPRQAGSGSLPRIGSTVALLAPWHLVSDSL